MSGAKLGVAFRNLVELSSQRIQPASLKIESAQLPKVVSEMRLDRIQHKPLSNTTLLFKWRHALRLSEIGHLTDREVKRLSWEPEASLSSQYLAEIESRPIRLGRAFIKGLTYSILTEWNDASSRALLGFIRRSESSERTSTYLKMVAPYLLSENGHVGAANALIMRQSNLQKILSEIFGIALSSTKYAHVVLEAVIEIGHERVLSANPEDRRWFYVEILQHVNKQVLLLCLEKVVKAIDRSSNEDAKEEFKRFVLHHPSLGDPRLPGYEGNWPKDNPITTKVIEWLSQSDIKFFFELFIQKQSDRQGRKKFWLKYAHLVKGTRVIVSNYDAKRLSRQISVMKERSGTSNLFADLQEGTEKSTGFLMDFGRVVVVEFSSYGHSCYFYSSDSKFPYLQRHLFWSTNKFSKFVLKDTVGSTECHSHHDGWEDKFENVLARYGLRPKVEAGDR